MFFLVCTGLVAQSAEPVFRAGAARVDIGPEGFPVRVNAMFTERSADRVEDPLFAKALALDDGRERIVVCVVWARSLAFQTHQWQPSPFGTACWTPTPGYEPLQIGRAHV